MPRPRLQKHTCIQPEVSYFKPRGVSLRELESVELSHEELEALWLSDYRNLEQIKAAKHMRTSQSTFQRILQSAHQKVARELIDGKAITMGKNSINK